MHIKQYSCGLLGVRPSETDLSVLFLLREMRTRPLSCTLFTLVEILVYISVTQKEMQLLDRHRSH